MTSFRSQYKFYLANVENSFCSIYTDGMEETIV